MLNVPLKEMLKPAPLKTLLHVLSYKAAPVLLQGVKLLLELLFEAHLHYIYRAAPVLSQGVKLLLELYSRHICVDCPTNQPSCDKEATCSCNGIRGSIWNPNFSTKICCDGRKEDHTEEEEKILKWRPGPDNDAFGLNLCYVVLILQDSNLVEITFDCGLTFDSNLVEIFY